MRILLWVKNLFVKLLTGGTPIIQADVSETTPLRGESHDDEQKQSALTKYSGQVIGDLLSVSGAMGGTLYLLSTYLKATENCPPKDEVCLQNIMTRASYFGLGFAYLDFLLQVLKDYTANTRYQNIFEKAVLKLGDFKEIVGTHAFLIQLILYLHTEIQVAFKTEGRGEVHIPNWVFALEVFSTTIIALLANPTLRSYIRNNILHYHDKPRNRYDKGLDIVFEFIRGAPAGRAFILNVERIFDTFSNSNFSETITGTWLRLGTGIFYGAADSLLAVKYPPKTSAEEILHTAWPTRMHNFLKAVLFITMIPMVLIELAEPHKQIQIRLASLLLFFIIMRSSITACLRNAFHYSTEDFNPQNSDDDISYTAAQQISTSAVTTTTDGQPTIISHGIETVDTNIDADVVPDTSDRQSDAIAALIGHIQNKNHPIFTSPLNLIETASAKKTNSRANISDEWSSANSSFRLVGA